MTYATTPAEDGNPNAPVLFLAEAPANVEMRLGKPLVGPSGDIFSDSLHAAGLIRHDAYILNVWPFQVYTEKLTGRTYMRDQPSVEVFNKKGFTDAGYDAALPTLKKAQMCRANLVVTLGKVALNLALDNRPIMKWRGSPLWSQRIGKKIIPTIHPAATIHGTYLWRYLITADFEKARRHMHTKELLVPQRKFILDPTFDDVMDYMRLCLTKPRIATDLEVINHQVNCFCLVHDPMEAMVVPVADENGEEWWDELSEMMIWQGYAKIMGAPEIAKVNQNLIGFDQVFLLMQNNIFTKGELCDNMIAQKIMYPEFNKGLDFITSIRTDEPYYKDEGKMWKKKDLTNAGGLDQWWTYNGKDGCVALESWDDLAEEMTQKEYWPTYNRVAARARFITYMSLRGLPVDRERLNKTHTDVAAKLSAKEHELETVAKYPFNPGSPKQCQQYFYAALGYTAYYNGSGGLTTDDKAMARLYRKYNCPEAKLVQEIRALRKLKSTYLEVQFDADSRLRCSWDLTGTKFGRLSSSATIFGTGMNQQNLHPEFKNFIAADKEPL